jgi:hypothetical protein
MSKRVYLPPYGVRGTWHHRLPEELNPVSFDAMRSEAIAPQY